MPGFPHERIVGRNTAVVAQTQDFAAQSIRILRISACGAHVEHAVAAEGNARSAGFRQNEDVLHVGKRAAIPAPARDRGGSFSAIQRLGVGEINEVIFGKSRMERDVHVAVHRSRPARFSGPIRGRSSRDRLGIKHATVPWISNDPKAACAFGDEHIAVRQEGQRPRIFEGLGDHHHADLLSFGGIELHRMIGQWAGGKSGGRNRNVERGIHRDLLLGGAELGAEGGEKRHGDRDNGGAERTQIPHRSTFRDRFDPITTTDISGVWRSIQTWLMSTVSSTGFGQPCLATLSMARPICSVVVTYFGKSLYNSGSSGPSGTYKTR